MVSREKHITKLSRITQRTYPPHGDLVERDYSQWANTRPLIQGIKSAVLDLNMERLWEQQWQRENSLPHAEDDPLFGSHIREAARIIREWLTTSQSTAG